MVDILTNGLGGGLPAVEAACAVALEYAYDEGRGSRSLSE